MDVLPKEATLVSFFVFLIVMLFVTLLMTLNMHNLSYGLAAIKRRVTETIRTWMQASSYESWQSREKSLPKPLQDDVVYSESRDRRTRSEWWYIGYLVFFIFWELPRRERSYGLRLLKPLRGGRTRFSFLKLLSDLVRLMLVPLWVVFMVVVYVFVLPVKMIGYGKRAAKRTRGEHGGESHH